MRGNELDIRNISGVPCSSNCEGVKWGSCHGRELCRDYLASVVSRHCRGERFAGHQCC